MNCRRCGEILNANANFCWSCGAPQHDATRPRPSRCRSSRRPSRRITNADKGPDGAHVDELVIITGQRRGQLASNSTKEVTTAGRHENSDLLLDDVSVSRHHAIFTRTASGRITLRDLNSLNGTYVNGARVEETTLHSADEVQIGKFKLVFWEATA